MLSNSAPEKIFQRQVAKEGLSNAIMDASRMAGDALKVPPRTPYLAARRCRFDLSPRSQARFTKEELRDIFSYNEFTACDTHELFGCECVVRGCPWAPAFILVLVSVVLGLQPLATLLLQDDTLDGRRAPKANKRKVEKDEQKVALWEHRRDPASFTVPLVPHH